jgi:hypothetical protein
MFKHHAVACDMPARIEADTAFGIGQEFYALGIKGIEASVGEDAPMRGLEIVQPFDLLFALEIAGGFGRGLETVEEIAEAGLQVRLQLRATAADEIAEIAVETGKSKAFAKATRLVPSPLFCRHVLHKASPREIDQPVWNGALLPRQMEPEIYG